MASFRKWSVHNCVAVVSRASAILITSAVAGSSKSYSLSNEELRLVNKPEFDNKVSQFASHAKTFITKPEENKQLARCFGNRYNDQIKLYYPNTNSGKFYPDSEFSYARVATATIKGSIPQIAELLFDGRPEQKGQWYSQYCMQEEQIHIVNKFDLEEADPTASHFGELIDQNAVAKKKMVKKGTSATDVVPANGVGSNIHFNYAEQMCARGLRPREFYSWHYKCPGATVGLFDNFNTVCLIQLDADRHSSLFKDYKQMREVVPEKSLNSQVVRGHLNSCVVLEYVSPEKTKVTYLVELDPNIHLFYPESRGGFLDWFTGTFQYLMYMSGADEVFMVGMLRALQKQIEGASQEEMGLSVEDAAKIRFKKQLTTLEQQQLAENLSMATTQSTELITDDMINDQEALVTLLTNKLANVTKEERAATATSSVPKEFYTSLRERIERDLKLAEQKLTSLKALKEK